MDAAASHIWQSTVVALGAGAIALMLKTNRAPVRYWVWFAASMKFLVPFAALSTAARAIRWPDSVMPIDTASPVHVFFNATALPPVSDNLSRTLVFVWLAGTLIVLARWWREWRRIAAIVDAAEIVTDGPVHQATRRLERAAGITTPTTIVSSDSSLEPGIFGVVKPVMIWPRSLSTGLGDAQIESLVAHEMSHLRRRDNLPATLQMLVTATFWFHPMVWWIGTRLVEERERACDEQVLALGQSPATYAAGIVKTCELCLASPLVNVPGVTGGDLKRRITRIMRNESGAPLGPIKKGALTLAAVLVLMAPLAAGVTPSAQNEDAVQAPRPGRDIRPPKIKKEVKPQYSERAKQEKIQGEVVMDVVVKADGTVGDVKVAKPLDPDLDQAAIDAVKQWEFEPGTRDGKPVAVMVTVAMSFTLK
jgi:TonB family protein